MVIFHVFYALFRRLPKQTQKAPMYANIVVVDVVDQPFEEEDMFAPVREEANIMATRLLSDEEGDRCLSQNSIQNLTRAPNGSSEL